MYRDSQSKGENQNPGTDNRDSQPESWNRCTGTVRVKGRTRILEQMYSDSQSKGSCTGTVRVKGRTRILEQMYRDSQSKGKNQNPGRDVQGQSE